jgi:L-amino acid N-acyltransferase YncA
VRQPPAGRPQPPRPRGGGPAIRLARAGDAEGVQAIYAPIVRDTAISFEVDPPGVAEMRRRITDTLAALPWLVSERDGELLGYAYAAAHRTRAAYRWSVDVSVYVAGHARRSGVGRGLYVPLLALLAAQGFTSAHAGITLPNPASVRLHQALGFAPVGVYRAVGFKLGSWHDVGWWQRRLREPAVPPPPPAALPDLPAEAVAAALAGR